MSAQLQAVPMLPVQPDRLSLIKSFSLADEGEDLMFGTGWASIEGDLRWTLGDHSDIILRAGFWPKGAEYDRILAVIEASPFLGLDFQSPQPISVSLNGRPVRDLFLQRTGLIAFWIPKQFAHRPLMIGFHHADARVPANYGLSGDTRRLAFAFHRMELWHIPFPADEPRRPLLSPAVTLAELLSQFESLGDNCEFGLLQRNAGIEPLGLFRFTATPLASLVDGLLHEFVGLGDKDAIEVEVRGEVREYILNERRWNLTYHTFSFESDMTAERVIHRESQKLTLLRRRMLDDLRAARRIYVVKRNDGLAEEDALALFILLNRFAENQMLFVTLADAHNPAHTVRQITPGLVQGYIDRFAPYDDAANIATESWFNLCRLAAGSFAGTQRAQST